MILLTGATGTTGFEVAKALSAKGKRFRAMVRNPVKATALSALPGAEVVAGDFGDAESVRRALSDVTRVFLLAPPVEDIDLVEIPFVDACKSAGVELLVNLSAVGARVDAPHRFGRWHGKTEAHLKASGLPHTILRPSFFMQNLLGMAGMAKGGTLYMPTRDGKAPFIDCRDIGAAAASVLAGEGHAGKVYELTGPVAIGYAEVAAGLGAVMGRPVNYVDVPASAAREAMMKMGMPGWLADALNELNEQMKLGRFEEVSDAVKMLTGKEPRTLGDFLRDHRAVFA